MQTSTPGVKARDVVGRLGDYHGAVKLAIEGILTGDVKQISARWAPNLWQSARSIGCGMMDRAQPAHARKDAVEGVDG